MARMLFRFVSLALASSLLCCASQPRAKPAPIAPVAAARAAPSAPAETITEPQELVGVWAEFWAPAGRADTQRYELLADGRFSWHASRSSAAQVTRRFGQWTLAKAAGATMLALRVQGHEERFGCEGSAACRVAHDPPLEEQLPLGPCPPNEEARALDASYRCLSIGGQAFWRQATGRNDEAAHR